MYQIIYADPPWSYRDSAADGKRGAGFKYPVMRFDDICRLPVWNLANHRSCLLAMWWVPTQPEEALAVMKASGFSSDHDEGVHGIRRTSTKGIARLVWATSPGPIPKIACLPCVGACLFDWMLRSVSTLPLARENIVPSLWYFAKCYSVWLAIFPGLNYSRAATYLVGIAGEMNVTVVSG